MGERKTETQEKDQVSLHLFRIHTQPNTVLKKAGDMTGVDYLLPLDSGQPIMAQHMHG